MLHTGVCIISRSYSGTRDSAIDAAIRFVMRNNKHFSGAETADFSAEKVHDQTEVDLV